jgi:hypothetical protein
MDDRKRNLEEEYFHRKNQEAIEKLRAKLKVAAERKAPDTLSLECPRCDGTLTEVQFEGVAIDICGKCAGVWLDAGELAQLTKEKKGTWLNRLLGSED